METNVAARLQDGAVVVDAHPFGGDGTVPEVAAVPHELSQDPRIPGYYNEKHGSLQNNEPVLNGLVGFLHHGSGQMLDFRTRGIGLSVTALDVPKGEPVEVRAHTDAPTDGLSCTVESIATGRTETHALVRDPGDRTRAGVTLHDLDPGDYRVTARGVGTEDVTDLVSVVDTDA